MTRYGGTVAACGLAGGMDLPATVAPFILRGVSLVGIDSVMCPLPSCGNRRGNGSKPTSIGAKIAAMTSEIGLDEVIEAGATDRRGAGAGPDRGENSVNGVHNSATKSQQPCGALW